MLHTMLYVVIYFLLNCVFCHLHYYICMKFDDFLMIYTHIYACFICVCVLHVGRELLIGFQDDTFLPS